MKIGKDITKSYIDTTDVETLQYKIYCLRIYIEGLLENDQLTIEGRKSARNALTLYN